MIIESEAIFFNSGTVFIEAKFCSFKCLKKNMQINVFRVNDNIPGFFLLLKGYIDA